MEDPYTRLKTAFWAVFLSLLAIVVVKTDIEAELSFTKNTREGIYAAAATKAEAAQLEK
jgi:hypothetical protein